MSISIRCVSVTGFHTLMGLIGLATGDADEDLPVVMPVVPDSVLGDLPDTCAKITRAAYREQYQRRCSREQLARLCHTSHGAYLRQLRREGRA